MLLLTGGEVTEPKQKTKNTKSQCFSMRASLGLSVCCLVLTWPLSSQQPKPRTHQTLEQNRHKIWNWAEYGKENSRFSNSHMALMLPEKNLFLAPFHTRAGCLRQHRKTAVTKQTLSYCTSNQYRGKWPSKEIDQETNGSRH
jgi:hypothetical protein